MTTFYNRVGNLLTITGMVHDPIYLTETHPKSSISSCCRACPLLARLVSRSMSTADRGIIYIDCPGDCGCSPGLRSFMQKKRCAWAGEGNPLMIEYHDREWGVPVHDDGKHFEFLVLEAAQAGLSWSIVLNKREGYRRAFSGFDPNKVARYTQKRVEKLLLDPGIVRNRLKIEAAIRNARAFLTIQEEFGSFDAYSWRFVGGQPKLNRRRVMKQIPATSLESDAFSKDLKNRGFSFVGSTVVYAHMQAVGMVNDHLVECFRYREVAIHPPALEGPLKKSDRRPKAYSTRPVNG